MTQRGARRDFQAALLDQGVEVVEFDFLTPEAVSYYCYDRGFLQVSRNLRSVGSAIVISGTYIYQSFQRVYPQKEISAIVQFQE